VKGSCEHGSESLVTTKKEKFLHKPQVLLNSINQLIFVMVKCGVLFEVRTELLNNI
jgi:hypothetical protein